MLPRLMRHAVLAGGRRTSSGSVLVTALALACAVPTVLAQPAWPSKPLKIVVGFPGGSSPDLMARTIADYDGLEEVGEAQFLEAASYRRCAAMEGLL